jgi:hypothetical protein
MKFEMSTNIKYKKASKLLFWSFFATIIILVFLLINSRRFLSYNHPIFGNILVIEGWVDQYALEVLNNTINLSSYEEIVIVGTKHPMTKKNVNYLEFKVPEKLPIWISHDGVIINPNKVKLINNQKYLDSITIFGSGTSALGRCAHISLFINNQYFGGEKTLASKTSRYTFKLSNSKISSIGIFLDNDFEWFEEDRNFTIDSVCIGGTCLNNPLDYLITRNNFFSELLSEEYSQAELCAMYLINLGDKIHFEIVDTFFNSRNNTFATAQKFSKWYISKKRFGKSVDIVSLDLHSRRTYIAYKKSLGKKIKIGIYSLPEAKPNNLKQHLYKKVYDRLEEYFKIFITFFI